MEKSKTTARQFTVTLAHKRNNKLKLEDGTFIQPKLDGVRCYTRLVDGEIKMFSRNHKEFHNCKHIKTELKSFFDKHPNVILDGELYNHKFKDNFNKIISLVRKQTPTQQDRFEASSHLQYHVYDVYRNDEELFVDRNLFILANLSGLRSIKTVETHVVWGQKRVDQYHINNKYNGYEGSMLRGNVPYEQKRSHDLQKVKDFLDEEATVIEAVEGKGKLKGKLGKFMMRSADGRVFGAPASGHTHVERQELWENKDKYIGTEWTYEFFELTPAGQPRFPVLKTQRNYE